MVKTVSMHKEAITKIKYSPCGKYLAFGCMDKLIDILDSTTNSKLFTLRGHQGDVLKIDWSEDSKYIISNCKAGELLIWDMKDGKQMNKGGSSLKNENWNNLTCIFGWYHIIII